MDDADPTTRLRGSSISPRRAVSSTHREQWTPPPFIPLSSRRNRLIAGARRFLDLQAASIWSDLRNELAQARGTVLDVGCGAQPYRTLLPATVCYIGIDIAEAEDHFGYHREDTRIIKDQHWPVEDGEADIVLCTETLEHVLDPLAFLAEAHRCVRPRGRLVLTVPFAARWHFTPYDYWRYTPSSLQHLLERSGFDEVEIFARGNALTVACQKVTALIAPLLMPQRHRALRAWSGRLGGALLLPLLVAVTATGQASLHGRGGADCLGFTVLARRADGEPPQA